MNRETEAIGFGVFLKQKRLALKKSLRTFCEEHGEDPSNWSKMERGVLKPPKSLARQRGIALKLGIQSPEELQRLFDLADAEQGRIPQDILSNKELVRHLPFVFRTIRGEVPTEDNLDKLADLIKEEVTPKDEHAK